MRRGKQRTMTNLSSVPSFRVQNPQSSQSRANQTVGHWEAEGRAGEGSGVGLSGDLALNASQWESRQIPEQVMELRGLPFRTGPPGALAGSSRNTVLPAAGQPSPLLGGCPRPCSAAFPAGPCQGPRVFLYQGPRSLPPLPQRVRHAAGGSQQGNSLRRL